VASGAALAALAGLGAGRALAEDLCVPFQPEMQAKTTPDAAIQLLMEGNARFVAGQSLNCDLVSGVRQSAGDQTPFACVLGCIDSRVSPELVFDQRIGDIFAARVAANVPTAEIIGSFEFGAQVAGARAILVLGHDHCGGIKGAIDKAVVGDNLTVLLNEIEPAVAATPLTGERSSKNDAFVQAVAETNVRMGVTALTERSAVLKALVDAGKLKIVGAMYNLETGAVTLLA
jgi:carbonic anhydrase